MCAHDFFSCSVSLYLSLSIAGFYYIASLSFDGVWRVGWPTPWAHMQYRNGTASQCGRPFVCRDANAPSAPLHSTAYSSFIDCFYLNRRPIQAEVHWILTVLMHFLFCYSFYISRVEHTALTFPCLVEPSRPLQLVFQNICVTIQKRSILKDVSGVVRWIYIFPFWILIITRESIIR